MSHSNPRLHQLAHFIYPPGLYVITWGFDEGATGYRTRSSR